ncbi:MULTISPECIES: hypothetical protein [Bacillaceae]|uniref:hypothetical protein n=1 Tax=Bacillaceae TaxID=186817 RepID=UPI000BFCA95B|nr:MULTISPECIES: hypothetical protein [Bacillaceae]MCM3164095.1 hypothetical protein [Metabacillus litoralis]PGT84549.1 hypothetical protein COD11_10570 [Bacillus sp. AFS040349]UGB33503.1 hypothetical protein LPC09_26505 [Metabacillus sp. B2-18]
MKSKIISLLIVIIMLPLVLVPNKGSADGKYPVRITEQNIVASPIDQNTLQLIQIVNFKNSGNKKEEQLPIYLPEGYSELQVRSGLEEKDMKVIDKGVVDVTGLDPGKEKQIVLSYIMPLTQRKSQWAIETSYVTESFQVIIQPGILSFEASNLVTQSDLFEMNNQEFRRFTRVDLHPDTPWTLTFNFIGQSSANNETSKVEDSSPSNYTEDGYKIIGKEGIGYGKAAITIAIIVIALCMTLIGLKRDYQKSINKSVRPTRTWLQTEKEILLQEMVQLEKDYQSKLISEKTYKETYNDIREKMIRVIAELR